MKTLVIGANGQIGRLLIPGLVAANHAIRAMVRDEKQRDALEDLGAEVIIGDLESSFEHALDDCDALVFTAGSGAATGADKTILIDMWGAMKTIDACGTKGVRRFIMISSRNAGDPDNGPAKIKHYNIAKHIADQHLQKSDLDWTILRPGRLTDNPATGKITTTRPGDKNRQIITRADTAACITICLDNRNTIGNIYELYQGNTAVNAVLK